MNLLNNAKILANQMDRQYLIYDADIAVNGANDYRGSGYYDYLDSGRSCGKRITSRIEAESVSSMTRRSMPIPSPAVGGRPCSRARI